jgi:hypothetical protein
MKTLKLPETVASWQGKIANGITKSSSGAWP